MVARLLVLFLTVLYLVEVSPLPTAKITSQNSTSYPEFRVGDSEIQDATDDYSPANRVSSNKDNSSILVTPTISQKGSESTSQTSPVAAQNTTKETVEIPLSSINRNHSEKTSDIPTNNSSSANKELLNVISVGNRVYHKYDSKESTVKLPKLENGKRYSKKSQDQYAETENLVNYKKTKTIQLDSKNDTNIEPSPEPSSDLKQETSIDGNNERKSIGLKHGDSVENGINASIHVDQTTSIQDRESAGQTISTHKEQMENETRGSIGKDKVDNKTERSTEKGKMESITLGSTQKKVENIALGSTEKGKVENKTPRPTETRKAENITLGATEKGKVENKTIKSTEKAEVKNKTPRPIEKEKVENITLGSTYVNKSDSAKHNPYYNDVVNIIDERTSEADINRSEWTKETNDKKKAYRLVDHRKEGETEIRDLYPLDDQYTSTQVKNNAHTYLQQESKITQANSPGTEYVPVGGQPITSLNDGGASFTEHKQMSPYIRPSKGHNDDQYSTDRFDNTYQVFTGTNIFINLFGSKSPGIVNNEQNVQGSQGGDCVSGKQMRGNKGAEPFPVNNVINVLGGNGMGGYNTAHKPTLLNTLVGGEILDDRRPYRDGGIGIGSTNPSREIKQYPSTKNSANDQHPSLVESKSLNNNIQSESQLYDIPYQSEKSVPNYGHQNEMAQKQIVYNRHLKKLKTMSHLYGGYPTEMESESLNKNVQRESQSHGIPYQSEKSMPNYGHQNEMQQKQIVYNRHLKKLKTMSHLYDGHLTETSKVAPAYLNPKGLKTNQRTNTTELGQIVFY